MSSEAERNYSKLSIIKKISVKHARGKNYLCILRTGNYITESLSYEEAIKEHATKKCRKKSVTEVCQAVNKNIVPLFWIL